MMTPFDFSSNPECAALADCAEPHVRDIVRVVFEHDVRSPSLVVYDCRCPLASSLAEAYRRTLSGGDFIDFDTVAPADIFAAFDRLKPGGFVVLIQTTNFRLDDFRIRVELFKRSLKVIEHPHLGRMPGPESQIYIDALAYDPGYYRRVGPALKARLDRAVRGVVVSGGERLVFDSPFETAKLNIGDYTGMKNTGGQFPIGEVFTEARDLEAVNGRLRVLVFGDTTFTANKPDEPILLTVERGRVTGIADSTFEFDRVMANIVADEGEIWVRELGFGLNRAFSGERLVSDIGTYERMCGVHLSLGAKHGLYKKPQFRGKAPKHHVDIFAVTDCVTLDDEVVYKDGAWQV